MKVDLLGNVDKYAIHGSYGEHLMTKVIVGKSPKDRATWDPFQMASALSLDLCKVILVLSTMVSPHSCTI